MLLGSSGAHHGDNEITKGGENNKILFHRSRNSVDTGRLHIDPEGLQPVSGFEANRYLGKWYEIARLDHSFERNLSNVTAEHSLREGGGIDVLNKGYDKKKDEWREIKGVARFIGEKNVGSLKVSFFGPFWGGYHLIAPDNESYRYSMVAGPSRSYLWILSRDKMLDQNIVAELLARAKEWDFETGKLIYVEHVRHWRAREAPPCLPRPKGVSGELHSFPFIRQRLLGGLEDGRRQEKRECASCAVELKCFCRYFDASSWNSRFDHLTPFRRNLFINNNF